MLTLKDMETQKYSLRRHLTFKLNSDVILYTQVKKKYIMTRDVNQVFIVK